MDWSSKTIILLIVLTIVLDFCLAIDNRFRWGWVCNDDSGLCERSSEPVDLSCEEFENRYTISQSICRLTCGQYGALWPRPTIQSCLSKVAIPFHISKLKFKTLFGASDWTGYLKEVQTIFLDKIEQKCAGCSAKSDNSVVISLSARNNTTALTHNTDESYMVNVSYVEELRKGTVVSINITAETVFGLRHGLETVSQLIASNRTTGHQRGKYVSLYIVRRAIINDKPAYAHRGLLLDTARNYLTMKTIKRQIDGMAMSKMNVLHWHATDTQSFPIIFPSVPALAKYGAYSEEQVYTFDDIEYLLHYCKVRGVRVIMEIDAPSHAGNGWQFGSHSGFGDLAVCVNRQPWKQYCIQPPCGQLNPVNKNVFVILGKLYADIWKVFPKGEMFHMGGDELFIPCWNSTEEILDYMNEVGMGRTTEDFLVLWGQYQQKALAAFDYSSGNSSSKIIVWSSTLTEPETITKFLDKNRYIVQTWVKSDDQIPIQLINKGYELIISTKDAWYLDHGFWGITTYYTWRKVFENKIIRHQNVLGGEVCMWAEYVDNQSIDAKVWPRAAAAAERLWVDSDEDTSGSVEPRFYAHRQRLVEEGIGADALTPGWCVQNEGSCL